jgi:hypothetical protein
MRMIFGATGGMKIGRGNRSKCAKFSNKICMQNTGVINNF